MEPIYSIDSKTEGKGFIKKIFHVYMIHALSLSSSHALPIANEQLHWVLHVIDQDLFPYY